MRFISVIFDIISLFALLAMTPKPTRAFSFPHHHHHRSVSSSSINTGRASPPQLQLWATTRKTFLNEVAATISSSTVFIIAGRQPAHADADSSSNSAAAASLLTDKLKLSAALRNVKAAQKKLISATTAEYVATNDYPTFKQILRIAPISEIRKAASTLIRGTTSGDDDDALQSTYKTFIAELEKLDGLASVAMRGRKLNDSEFQKAYDATVSALQEFVAVAERSVASSVVADAEQSQ